MSVSVAQAQWFFMALTRILAIIIQVPVLGGRQIPNQVKIGLGIFLAIIIIPWTMIPPETAAMPTYGFALGVGKEFLIGTVAGLAAMLTFGAFEITGNVLGISSGFGSSQTINPMIDFSGSAIGQLYYLIAVLLFIVLNGHHVFIIALQRMFELIPLNSPMPIFSFEYLIRTAAELIVTGIHMALPVFGALLLTDLALALLARVAPTVQVFFLGVPLKIGVGIIALGLALEFMLPGIRNLFEALPERMLELVYTR